MIERELGEGDVARLVAPQPFVEHHRLGKIGHVDLRIEVRHHHDLAQAGQLFRDLGHARERVVLLAVVAVAVGAEQHLGLDLAEAVEHALHAEVGRAARPHGAEARRGEHRGGRFREVGQIAGDAIALADAHVGERLRHA